jgi:wyosine [tRNA(Phe)-imidazoG37] synthetase (radical SAM superfamily)
VKDLVEETRKTILQCERTGEAIDYLTIVSDGEPTLDSQLEELLLALKPFSIPLALISNASLLWMEPVQHALLHLDWLSVKIDSVREATWRTINRPHKALALDTILESILTFRVQFKGKFTSETMLVSGCNDSQEEISSIAGFLKQLQPDVGYIAVPTRPPAESWVKIPPGQRINAAYQLFKQYGLNVELLTAYEGDQFAPKSDPIEDLLSIISVHPMRRTAIENLLEPFGLDWEVIEDLVRKGRITSTDYEGETYFLRSF